MSNEQKFQEIQAENEAILRLSKETLKKKTLLDAHKVSEEYERLISNANQVKQFNSVNLDMPAETETQRSQRLEAETEELALSLQNKLPFVSSALTEMASFSYSNILLVCGKTGDGKSTTAANIIHPLIQNGKRVLIITNEEREIDVLNRISCLDLGYDYADLGMFTKTQLQKMSQVRDSYLSNIVIVDQNYNGNHDFTTTYEGVTSVLNSLMNNHTKFDAVVVDYYQKICNSKGNTRLEGWKVLENFSYYLDNFRKTYRAPVVLMCQLHPNKNDEAELESRIKGGKSIAVVSTFIVEIKPNFKERTTEWICHKKRFRSALTPLTLMTKMVHGRFVDHDPVGDVAEILNPNQDN